MNAKPILLASITILFLLSACSTEAKASDQQTFTGTIMTGAQIGKAKNYCAEGYIWLQRMAISSMRHKCFCYGFPTRKMKQRCFQTSNMLAKKWK